MTTRHCLTTLLLSGCSFQISATTTGDDGPTIDASSPDGTVIDSATAIDASNDAPCSWALHFDACSISPPPAGGVVLTPGAWVFNTDTKQFSPAPAIAVFVAIDTIQPGMAPAVVLAVDTFDTQLGATLRVIGSKPLIIGSWTTIVVDGVIDAGSKRGGTNGAGVSMATCSPNGAGPGTATNAGGGGGGGGFRGAGGTGGNGDGAPGGSPGAARSIPSFVRAGCPGMSGGLTGFGTGGAGGGAIELVARTSIEITGTVTAGGAGAQGGGQTGTKGGGGGGGSGGLVGIDTPALTLGSNSVLAANGGGGGGGGNGLAQPGQDGPASTGPATGGSGARTGGAGGNGSTLDGETPSASGDGGAGAGGGAGFILVRAPGLDDQGAVISPSAQPQ